MVTMYKYKTVVTVLIVSVSNAVHVTGFWKTDRIVTLGLFHFIGTCTANGYTCTVHYIYTVSLAGLADWSAFLEFC